jgi:hypothetical protein
MTILPKPRSSAMAAAKLAKRDQFFVQAE